MSFKNLFRKKNNTLLFTTPSHSQKFCILKKFRHFYACDISETDTHNPQNFLVQAQTKAAEIYGTKQTLFLTNGSSSGIIAGVIALTKKGDKVLLWENSHRCHKNGVELAGGIPVYYQLPHNEFGVPDRTPPKLIENFLCDNKDIKVVIVTSPTYEGYVSDIKTIKSICSKHNAKLIVDEAHGALYPFSDNLPESAVKYADITVQSLHKTAGGLNPTALIHSNLDFDIQPALDKITTTSPSYPLLASIEQNIFFLNSKKGKKSIENLITNIKNLRQNSVNIEFGGDDITKILIKKEGYTGFKLSELLYENNIEDEKTNNISTMLLCGIGTTKQKLKKLQEILSKIK